MMIPKPVTCEERKPRKRIAETTLNLNIMSVNHPGVNTSLIHYSISHQLLFSSNIFKL